MAADVVGTAYVRIRALTKQLGDDIKQGVDKGVKDANIGKSGSDAGEIFGDGLDSSLGEKVPKAIEGAFDGDGSAKHAGDSGDRGGSSWSSRFHDSISGSMGGVFKKIFGGHDKDIEVGGHEGGKTYGKSFGDGVDESSKGGVFKGLLSSLRNGVSGLQGILSKGIDFNLGDIFGNDNDNKKNGESTGKKLADGLKSGLTGALGGLSKAIGPMLFNPVIMIGGLVVALTPLLISTVVALGAMAGTLMSAAIGGALALGAVAIAGGLALGPIIAAFTVKTPLLALFKEELGKIGEKFKGIAEAVQGEVLPGVLNLVGSIAKKLLPTIKTFAVGIGKAFGDFTDNLAKLLTSSASVERIGNILTGSASAFRSLLEGIIPLTDFVFRVLEGLMPLAKVVADDLKGMFTRWNEWAAGVGASGLEGKFQAFYDSFKLVGGGLTDLTVALYNALMIGSDSAGTGFFERFAVWADNFRTFTTSEGGIDKIQGIFERAQPVFSEFAGLLGDIVKLVWTGGTSEGSTNLTLEVLTKLREDVLPWLVNTGFPGVRDAIHNVTDAFRGAGDALSPFADAMKIAFSPAVKEVIDYIKFDAGDTMGKFKDTLENLEGPLTRIGKALGEGLGSFFKVLRAFAESGVFEAFLKILVGVVDIISRLVSIPGVAEFLGLLAGAYIVFQSLAFIAGVLAGGINLIVGAIGLLLSPIGIIVAIGVAIAALVFIIYKNWDTIVRFFKELPEKLKNFVARFRDGLHQVGQFFGGLWDKITKALGDIGGAIVRFVAKIPGQLASVGGKLLSAIGGGIAAVARALPGMLLKLLVFFVRLPIDIALTILDFGVAFIAQLVYGFIAIGFWIATVGIPSVVTFFTELPGKIWEAIKGIASFLSDVVSSAFTAVTEFLITNVPLLIQWFIDLPGKIWEAIKGLAAMIGGAFKDAWDASYKFVTEGVAKIVTAIGEFIASIPGKAVEAFNAMVAFGTRFLEGLKNGISGVAGMVGKIIVDIKDSVIGGIKSFVNDIIGKLEGALSFHVDGPGPLPDLDFSIKLPRFAKGGIFDQATTGIMGEAGREVLLPLTDAKRTLQLALSSGLFDVLAKATRQGPTSAPLVMGGGGTDTASNIDRLATKIIAALPSGGDTVQLIMPEGIGASNAVAVAMESTRQLRSDRWRRGK